MSKGPVYDSSNRCKRKLPLEIADIIDAHLSENEQKHLDGRSKQQLRKIDIYEQLAQAGYELGYSTVCEYICHKTARMHEAFVNQGYGEAAVCEFDWAEVKLHSRSSASLLPCCFYQRL